MLRDLQEYVWSGSMANMLGLVAAVFGLVVAVTAHRLLTRMTMRNVDAAKALNVELKPWMNQARLRYAREKLVPARKRKAPGERTLRS